MRAAYNRLLFEYGLPHRAVVVYMYLRERQNPVDGRCFPAVSTIAEHLSCSPRTVYRALNELEQAGFVERIPRSRASGARSSSQYWLKK